MTLHLHGIAPIQHLGVIRVEGEDAAKFLHGQLTQDFALLGLDQARLAGFLSVKGRVQASFIGFKRSANEILLLCSADLLEPTLKRISMFVMRAKAKLSNASDEFSVYGVAGDALTALNAASASAAPWHKADLADGASLITLYPAAGQARALWVAPVGTPAPQGEALPSSSWLWSEIQSGIATVSAPVSDAFVPQMLNYESVGGVNFKKGCYPGQEVVARSQFRGTLKRRTYLLHSATPVVVGAEVFEAADLEQPCGTVVQVAAVPNSNASNDAGFDLLVSMQIAASQGQLQVGTAPGTALSLQPLPYELLADI